jgi:hypothetical protein
MNKKGVIDTYTGKLSALPVPSTLRWVFSESLLGTDGNAPQQMIECLKK